MLLNTFKVTVDLRTAFQKLLCLRAAFKKKTTVNYISLES